MACTACAYLLAPQDRKIQREGIPEAVLKRESPKTYSYLKKFEKELSLRADRKFYPEGSPFYTIRNMASYSLSPWKVTWPEVGHTVAAGVCGPQKVGLEKPTLPDHTVVAVSCESKEEAFYIAALLNSSSAQLAIYGYIVLHPSHMSFSTSTFLDMIPKIGFTTTWPDWRLNATWPCRRVIMRQLNLVNSKLIKKPLRHGRLPLKS